MHLKPVSKLNTSWCLMKKDQGKKQQIVSEITVYLRTPRNLVWCNWTKNFKQNLLLYIWLCSLVLRKGFLGILKHWCITKHVSCHIYTHINITMPSAAYKYLIDDTRCFIGDAFRHVPTRYDTLRCVPTRSDTSVVHLCIYVCIYIHIYR